MSPTIGREVLGVRRLAVPVLLILVTAASVGAADGDGPDLASGDLAARLASAAEWRAKDVFLLGRALLDLGGGDGREGDLEFLTAYAIDENSRALRVLAIGSAGQLDRKGAFESFRKVATTSADERRAAYATEALGYLATEADSPAVRKLIGRASPVVAVAALEALARFAPAGDVEEVVAAGLAHPDEHVHAHVAYAAMDIGRKKQRVKDACRKAERANPDVSPRAKTVVAVLDDEDPKPWRWGDPRSAIRHLFAARPAEIRRAGFNPDIERWLDVGVANLAKKYPAEYWLVATFFPRITSLGTEAGTEVDLRKGLVNLSYDDAALPPDRLAVYLTRRSVLGLRQKLKEPWEGHRGWEAALLDTYDRCCEVGMNGCGKAGGKTLEQYLVKMLNRRPWELD